MLEHTSGSKNSTKPTPIMIMRDLYRSYSRNHKPKSQSDANLNIDNKPKSSTKKFTTFLNNIHKN